MKQLIMLAFTCLALMLPTGSANAVSKDDLRVITMTGRGLVKAAPDIARISTGVVSEADTAGAALKANTAAMSKVVAELKASGIDAKDIQTARFAVNPRHQRNRDGREPKIIGYRVTNSVRITVRDLKALGGILDKVVSLGSNQIDGIAFDIDEPRKLQDEARRRAVKDAKAKAELYAEAADVDLGDILSISEGAVMQPRRPVMARMAMEAKSADVPIEPGEQAIEVRVSMSWEID